MKAKSISKRVLSVLLCTVMLFSCWVFTAPKADAAYSAGAGTYNVKIVFNSENKTGGWNSHTWTFYGKSTNGTGSETSLGTLNQSTEYTGDKTLYENTSCSYFPTKVTFSYNFGGGFTWREYKGTLKIYVNGTEIHSEWKNAKSSAFSSASGTHTWTVASDKYPKASTMEGFSVSGGTVTADSNTFTVSGPSAVKDQYGTVISSSKCSTSYSISKYKSNNSSGSDLTQDITIGASSVSAASGGYKAQSYATHWARASCSSSFNSGTASATSDFSLTYKSLTATWNYYTNNSNGSTGTSASATSTVYFGDTPSRSDLTNNYYDNTYHHSGGTFSTSRMTANTSFTMTYTTNLKHSMETYIKLTNDNVNHTKKCTGCDYSVAEAHDFGDYHSVNTDSHSQTCSKCNYVKTVSHSYGGWQIIPDPDTENNHEGHSREAEHFRECSCGHKDYDNHKWVAQAIQAPTCTSDGHTPYKCSECQMTTIDLNEDGDGKDDFVPRLGHHFEYYADGEKTLTQHTEKCSRCTATQKVNHPGYGAWYSVNGTTHAHRCTICDKEITQAHGGAENANWSGWLNQKPGEEETGIRATVRANLDEYDPGTHCFNYCTDCGYVKTQPHPGWNTVDDDEVTYPATCTEAGQKTEVCTDCGKTKVTPLSATGHSWSEEPISSGLEDARDGTGFLYFECQNCGSCCPAQYEYNEEKEEYTYVENDTIVVDNVETLENNEEVLEKVPTPFFNDDRAAAQFYNIDYSERQASLRFDLDEDYQGLRFIGSVKIPSGVSYQINPTANVNDVDNVVLDFGFVWTQTRFICPSYRCAHDPLGDPLDPTAADPTRLVFTGNAATGKPTAESGDLGYQIYQSSVVRNNATSGIMDETASNWSGVTMRMKDEKTDNPSYYYSFNLVINTTKTEKANNWAKEYSARPYITYKYHGQVYTVYDGGRSATTGNDTYSHRSVYSIVNTIMRRDPTYDVTDLYYYWNMNQLGFTYDEYLAKINGIFRDKQYCYDKFYSDMTEDEFFYDYCYQQFYDTNGELIAERDWWPSYILQEFVPTREEYDIAPEQ